MLLGAQVMREIAVAISVPLSAILVGAIIAGVAQSRFQLAPKALEWKAERLNFAAGFQRMFLSSQPLMELAKSLGKLFLLSWVTWMAVSSRLDMLPSIATVGSIQLFRIMVDLGLTVVMYAIPLLLVLAAADYSYQHWRTNEDQKMTLKEVKDERKDQDGDPIVKAARRARAREYSMGNLLSKVREADVVVTNPTHYAVAIKYDKSVAPAPIILAMGVDHMALKIRQEAMRFDVPRVENRSLARALYATGKLHKIIPDDLYGPVAQVLATIYKRRMKRRIRMGNQGMSP
jgi:flagellar biosynthetic protein FlhB